MKGSKWITGAIAVSLGLLLALGCCGCLVSAFGLTIEKQRQLLALWAGAACFCAAAFSRKRGWLWVTLAGTAGAFCLWRIGGFWQQLWQLVYRITHVYNKAYHWGVFKLVSTPWNAGTAEQPVALWGLLVIVLTAWAICQGRSAAFPVLSALLPLLLCVVVTDTVPSPLYLYLLILGILLLLLGSHPRRGSAWQGNRLFFLTALPVALCLGLLFQTVPQEGYVNHSGALREKIAAWFQALPEQSGTVLQEMTGGLQTREPGFVDLSAIGSRRESTIPVLYASAETGGTLYLRGRDYDHYDGKGWQASPYRVEPFRYAGVALGYVAIETRREQEQLYLPYYPRDGLSLIGGQYENTRIVREYSFLRTGLPENWQKLAQEGEDRLAALPFIPEPPIDRETYLSLPEQTRLQAAEHLEGLLDELPYTFQKAQAIAGFVRASAPYDKDPERMPPEAPDFALWFLDQGNAGYCVHFATASAVLLRAAGIPARYVSGYLVPAEAGKTVAVTGELAHAWAEYYDPGLDTWVVLEATPAEGLPAMEPPGTEETLPVTTAPESLPPETEAPADTQPPETLRPTLPPETHSPQPLPEEAPKAGAALPALLGILGALLALEGQRWLRLCCRRRRQRRGSPNQRALRLWQEAEAMVRLLGQPKPTDLEQLALKAKFSQHTLTEEELSQFTQFLAHRRTQLKAQRLPRRLLLHYWFALI